MATHASTMERVLECHTCGLVFLALAVERDLLPSEARPQSWRCPSCDGLLMSRVLRVPASASGAS